MSKSYCCRNIVAILLLIDSLKVLSLVKETDCTRARITLMDNSHMLNEFNLVASTLLNVFFPVQNKQLLDSKPFNIFP